MLKTSTHPHVCNLCCRRTHLYSVCCRPPHAYTMCWRHPHVYSVCCRHPHIHMYAVCVVDVRIYTVYVADFHMYTVYVADIHCTCGCACGCYRYKSVYVAYILRVFVLRLIAFEFSTESVHSMDSVDEIEVSLCYRSHRDECISQICISISCHFVCCVYVADIYECLHMCLLQTFKCVCPYMCKHRRHSSIYTCTIMNVLHGGTVLRAAVISRARIIRAG